MLIDENHIKDKDDMYLVHGHIFSTCRPVIMDFVDRMITSRIKKSLDEPIEIADFGTADGKTTFPIINEIIATVRSRCGQIQQMTIYYNDQIMNDFNILGRALKGNEQNSGLNYDENVYAAMIPRTLFEQCLPNNSLDLSISSLAVHYLSSRVCNIKNGVFYEEGDHKERNMWEEKARDDWRTFLVCRGRELKPGGHLVVLSVSSNRENMVPSTLSGGPRSLGAIARDMKADCTITEEEFLETNLNAHYMRKEADFLEPFTMRDEEICKLGLQVYSIRTFTSYYQNHYTFDITDKEDAEKRDYAEQIAASIKPWMHHVIYNGLSSSRTETEKQDIVDEYFRRVYEYAYDNSDHKPYLVLTEIVIKKELVY